MEKKSNVSDAFNSGVNNVLGGIFSAGADNGGFIKPPDDDILNGNRTTDAWYWKYIEQYKNDPMYNELLSNTGLISNNARFSPNLFQQIAEYFGDTSARDSYYANLLQSRNAQLKEWEAQRNQRLYNEPSAQAQRMADAGQNADLLGTSGVASAPENDQPFTGVNMQPNAIDPLSAMQGFVSMFMQAYSFASGFAKDVLSLKSMATGLDNQEFELGSKISQEVDDYVKNHIAEPRFNKDYGYWEFPDLSLDALDSYARQRFHTRSSRERFKNGVRSGYGSAQREFLKRGIIKDAQTAQTAMSDAIGVNLSRGAFRGNLGYSDPIIDVSEELEKMNLKIMKVTQKKDYNTADFHAKYYGALDADKHAKGANDEAEMKSLTKEALEGQREVEQIMNDTLSNVVYGLSKDAKNGNLLAEGLLLFFSAYRSSMIPKLW